MKQTAGVRGDFAADHHLFMMGESVMPIESTVKICAMIEIAVLLVGITAAILDRKRVKTVIRILGMTAFVSLAVMILPYHVSDGSPHAFRLSVFDAMCAMLMNAEASEILDTVGSASIGFVPIYRALLLFFFIVAPLFTVGITLSFFSDRFTRAVCRIRSAFSDSYLFSAINERMVCLAENIAVREKKPLILFVIPGDDKESCASASRRPSANRLKLSIRRPRTKIALMIIYG